MHFEPKTNIISQAWQNIKREDFVLEEHKKEANLDQPLSIGYGQTISQPSVVAFMLELLHPKIGGCYLDIGSGSGWTTALLAHITGKHGKVYAMEIKPELLKFGRKNVNKYDFIDDGIVTFVLSNGRDGYEENAPFDGILVSASVEEIPQALLDQLKVGGCLVIPVHESILQIKKEEKQYIKKEFPGFIFVPFLDHD